MRLLNAQSKRLCEFVSSDIPKYAILSHTWEKDEVAFRDLKKPDHKTKDGYKKIEYCCQQAEADGLEWVWIDTCCINKDSSSELSEAINSMFRWYENAQVCYIYLSDVRLGHDPLLAFRKSRWFTRGWTLQELLAPSRRVFYDKFWSLIGAINIPHTWSHFTTPNFTQAFQPNHWRPHSQAPKSETETRDLGDLVEVITGIEKSIITHSKRPDTVVVAQRMSWASERRTSRVEDLAYCLLGIFGVNMPLLYGEGSRAFVRLQEEIIRMTYDHSIFAWGLGEHRQNAKAVFTWDLLARHPRAFRTFGRAPEPFKAILVGPHYSMTNFGVHIELPMICFEGKQKAFLGTNPLHLSFALGLLDVSVKFGEHQEGRLAIPLVLLPGRGYHLRAATCRENMPFVVPATVSGMTKRTPVYLSEDGPSIELPWEPVAVIKLRPAPGWVFSEYFPPVVVNAHYDTTTDSTHIFADEKVQRILIRYYHVEYGSLLLLLCRGPVGSVLPTVCVGGWSAAIAKVTDSESDWSLWRTLLEPDYQEFNFGMLLERPRPTDREAMRWGMSCEISKAQSANLSSADNKLLLVHILNSRDCFIVEN
ncbi:HET-domain-containing protein [Nemania abortiva]|nr:HET-domain-containing protein [Nemania abortiva]